MAKIIRSVRNLFGTVFIVLASLVGVVSTLVGIVHAIFLALTAALSRLSFAVAGHTPSKSLQQQLDEIKKRKIP